MSSDSILVKVKQLRELTGVGFKDCKLAIDENSGDLEKSVEFLRKKGIAKANKKMERTASDGLVSIEQNNNKFSIIEINSETDFVAKNIEFSNFVEEVSKINLNKLGIMENIMISKMSNNKTVNENLISLIAKIGEKITITRSEYLGDDNCFNFSYVHSSSQKNVGKIGVLLSLKSTKSKSELTELGKQISMHIAALSPLAIDKDGIDQKILDKEKEIITEELKNSGKDPKIIDKIALGKINKFVNDNTLLNQDWIMEPKKKVKEVIKDFSEDKTVDVVKFVRFKVGEKF